MRSATRENLLKVARFESFTGTGAASRAADLMDDSPAIAQPISFDPGVISAEGLVALAARIAEAAARHELTKDATVPDVPDVPDGEPALAAAVAEASLPAEHAAAGSEDRVRSAPPPLPVESEPPAAPVPSRAVSVPAPAPGRRPRVYAVVAALFTVNAALVAGAIRLDLEVKREHVPMATVSAEVTRLKADQVDVHAKLDEARAQIEQTRARLDEQTGAVAEAAQRQKDADRDARERDAHEARELAALSARVSRTDKHTYKLDEAIKLIDLVEHRQPTLGPPGEPIVPIINP